MYSHCFTSGCPEPEVVWYRDGTQLDHTGDDRIIVNKNLANGIHLLQIKSASEADSGKYTATVKNNLGSQSFSIHVTVHTDKKDEPVIVQEVVAGEKLEETEEILGEEDEVSTKLVNESVDASLEEKFEEAEKLIIVDTKGEEEFEETKKKERKKKVASKKEVVMIHQVEEQVSEDVETVKEMKDTVSSSELQTAADSSLTEDSLHKLEPFVMLENRRQKTKTTEDESIEEEEDTEVVETKEVHVIHKVEEKSSQEETVDATGESLTTIEARQIVETRAATEKVQESEKLIVIDNQLEEEEKPDKKKKKSKTPKEVPKNKKKSSMHISVEETSAESDLEAKKKKGEIAVSESVEESSLKLKSKPKKPWDDTQSESETESDTTLPDEPELSKPVDDLTSASAKAVKAQAVPSKEQAEVQETEIRGSGPGEEKAKKPWEESDSDEEESDEEPVKSDQRREVKEVKPWEGSDSESDEEELVKDVKVKSDEKTQAKAKKPWDEESSESSEADTGDRDGAKISPADGAVQPETSDKLETVPDLESRKIGEPVFTMAPQSVTAATGGTVTLTCQVQG